uniref:Dus domain-containing protein n=1 Tax=Meloidogyne hapla TaxID=6305 RepID=A0A1I8BDF7_MELHA
MDIEIGQQLDDFDLQTPPLFVAAPMVRYSKFPFRRLVKKYGCDIVYTPMIYADCFIKSEKCRAVEFVPNEEDFPIVQFAAKKPEDFAGAAELVYGHCQGIDLNCGCPKRDVRSQGFGSKLLDDPQLIFDIVRQCRGRISDPDFSISIKIRLKKSMEETVDICRKAEYAGISHIAVHGRTVEQRNEPPSYDSISTIKQALKIPVYANGNCKTRLEALKISKLTKADGIMVANGLLDNPAMFAGYLKTPKECILDWLEMENNLPSPEKKETFLMR